MKKKKKQPKRQQKIDVVLASLLNLELQVKELIKKIERLQYSPPQQDPPKYWPVDYSKYREITNNL